MLLFVAALTSTLGAAGGLLGCFPVRPVTVRAVEMLYEDARGVKDRIDVTRDRGAPGTPEGVSLRDLIGRYRVARERLREGLASVKDEGLGEEDRRALEVMRRTFANDLGEEKDSDPEGDAAAPKKEDVCDYDPAALAAGPEGQHALASRMYACFGEAAHALPFEGQVLDRLTVFSLLPVTDDPVRRRNLFMAFGPVWKSVNGDGGPDSPYRRLIPLSAARFSGEKSSVEAGARSLGIEPSAVEPWLVSVLEAWRAGTQAREIEPWDFAYETGRASRALRAAIPLEALSAVNQRFYADLGADPAALGIRYDLEPRDGKDPVAFTTFGARPRLDDGAWRAGEPWVFASYKVGSVDNLNELLHETGHGIHIAAIRTRPAFMDWPDSDLFTEAIADVAALEMFEPAWQRRYLGTEVPLEESIRAKYAGIVMDTAWALFEIRMHRNPAADPNRVWTDLTARYFRIRPHPELSWWAVRGQLINAPGYMLNYAVGAILIADLRARVHELHGPYAEGDPAWYAWMSERLYRFGLERTSRRVIEDFLGRPVSARPLLDDLARARVGAAAGR